MKQNKQTYLSPVTETLVLQPEGSTCGATASKDAFVNAIIYGTDGDTINDNGDF